MRFRIRNGVLVRFSDELAENVTVPPRVRKIGRSAFEQCQGLRQITLPSHLTEIGEYAFSECRHLKYVTFSGGKKAKSPLVIKDRAFSGCALLEQVDLPEEIAAIESFAFSDCVSLHRLAPTSYQGTGVFLPEGFAALGVLAFDNCLSLPSVRLPSTMQSCGRQVLRDCKGLEEVIIRIPDGSEYRFPVAEPDCMLDMLLLQDYEAVQHSLGALGLFGEMLENGYCSVSAAAHLAENRELLYRNSNTFRVILQSGALPKILQCEELLAAWTEKDSKKLFELMTTDWPCKVAFRDSASLAQILQCRFFTEHFSAAQLERLVICLINADMDREIVPRIDYAAIFRAGGTWTPPKLSPRNTGKLISLVEKSGIPALLPDAFLEKLAVLANDNKEYELELFWLNHRKNSSDEDRFHIIDRFDL